MAVPIADETLNEWIELYNNDSNSIDVSGFIIGDDSDSDALEGGYYGGSGTVIPPYGHAIITDETTRVYNNFNVSNNAIKLYTDDSSIGNGLKNSGETIYLYNNNRDLINSIAYNQTERGKCFAFYVNYWREQDCTPGYNNNGSIQYPEETNNCDWKIEILLNKTTFESKDEFEFKVKASKIKGDSTNITGTIKIEDLFGNTIKEYNPWTNEAATYQKTSSKYSPSLQEGKIYLITSNLEVQCPDDNLNNNINQKTITIKGASQSSTSSIEIEKIYDLDSDNTAKFGQTISIKLKIYKGDTTKEVITAWIGKREDKISKISKTSAYNKFAEYGVTLPIQLKPNCDSEYDDGKYKIEVEGLDASAEEEIKVEDISDDLCETESKKESSRAKLYYELIDAPLEIENNQEFEIKIRIDNNDIKDHEIYVWSYVYRGSKSYSGDKESNKEHLAIKKRSSKEIALKNIVTEAEPGEYNLMVKIIKDNQKTEQKISQKVDVIEEEIIKDKKEKIGEKYEKIEEKEEKTELSEKDKEGYFTTLESTKQPRIIYESPSAKAQKLVVWFFIGFLVVYASILTLKR